MEKSEKGASQKLRDLCSAKFKCQQDAQEAANNLFPKLKGHNLVDIQTIEVLPKSAKKASLTAKDLGVITYQVKARLERDKRRIEIESRGAGRFVLATNILDVEELSNDEMVSKYKEQQSPERGFGFLKDPLFFTDSVFLKSPERVSALALLMGLCLLVYTLAQIQLRQTLKTAQSGIKNQLGKLTSSPTLRLLCRCFQSVHLLTVNGVKQIYNLTPERLWIPAACRKYYLLI